MKSLSIDALPYPAAVIDSAYSIRFVNRRFAELIGYEREEMFSGLPLQALLYSHVQNEFRHIVEQHKDRNGFHASLIHSEGYILDAKVRLQTEPQSGDVLVLLEPEEETGEQQFESIECRLARSLVSASTYENAYKKVLKEITTYFQFTGGALYLSRGKKSRLELKSSYSLSEQIRNFLSKHTPEGWASLTAPLLFESNSRKNPISPLLRRQGVHTLLLLPIGENSSLDAAVVLLSYSQLSISDKDFEEIYRVHRYLGTIFSRLNYEEELESGEELFRSLVRSMPSGLVVRDETENVILYNLAAARLFSLRNDTTFDPATIYDNVQILHKDGEPLEHEKLPGIVSIRDGRKIRNYDLRIIREDGTHRWLSVNSEPLFRSGEIKPYAAVATFKDITENRRILKEIERAKQTAEEANQSKSRFLANISHEIRTPLSGIMGMTDILLSGDVQKDQREQLFLMKDAEESLLDIINKVLELSKIESGNIIVENNAFSLRHTVKKAILPLFMGKKESKLALDIHIEDHIPDILLGDALRLQQVLANLVSNAMKFTENGFVSVSVKLEGEEKENVTLRFSVKDSGVGIPGTEQKRIFENFQQVDSSFSKIHQGSGLGLSITKQIVEIMGGQIQLKSSPGKGSIFFFILSFKRGKIIDKGRMEGSSTALAAPKSLSILLAEDNELNQKSISYFLEEMGYRVEIAPNGSEALKILNRGRFDLVLMDVQMPVMNGLEATRKIREAGNSSFDPQIPIIALTAYAMKEDVQHILSSGMNAYVSKPLSRDILAEAIAGVLRAQGKSSPGERDVPRKGAKIKGEIPEIDISAEASLTDFSTFVQDYRGDLDIAKQLLELFYRDVPGRIKTIEEALAEGELNKTVDEFHSLTNNLSAVRLYSLGNMSRKLEREALRGNVDRVNKDFSEMKQELQAAVKQSQHYLSVISEMLE